VIGDWGKEREIQVQPSAVQSKLKRMLSEMGERRALYIPLIRPLSENCSKVPPGPSNLSTYLQCDQSFERTALGLRSNRNQGTLAQFLKEMGEIVDGNDSQGGKIAALG
jgi:hypothetical protein